MNYHKIDIILLQEHNIRNKDNISSKLNDKYFIIINLAINHKGGTAIVIDKRLDYKVKNYEMSANSRIISALLEVNNKPLHLINIYAPSGSKNSDRDNFFNNDLTYYLRNNLDNTIIGGDFNCITESRDSSSSSTHVCKALSENFKKGLNMKDAWFICNRNVEYTYIRQDYGSRLDRFYTKNLSNNVKSVIVKHISFSDHSCVQMEVKLSDIKIGKFYWKLNVSLLNETDIEDDFNLEWNRLKNLIDRYSGLNEWWERCAKKGIKEFFIKQGRIINQGRYGLLKYLEYSLNRLYNKNNIENKIDYKKVKQLKDRISGIQNDILEGVKIRSRIEEQLQGEKISNFLIKKQAQIKTRQHITKIKSEPNIIDNLGENIVLDKTDIIELYIHKYYEKLYKEEPFNESEQNIFLNYITDKLSNNDKEILGSEITDEEIFNAVKSLSTNKAPGIDGIPIEFYQKFWKIIKNEVTQIIKNIITGTLLLNNQRKAIITLLPKGGDLDLNLLKSWRPISLICCDTKIISKILANRIKPFMTQLISNNQYCVNGRTITKCNTELRDTLYYYGENKSTGAIINLDWEKAFDRVNWIFLINIMKKMGFPEYIIKWVLILHNNIQSVCMINGNITKPFDVKRGVRQGCPMSMIFYVLFQEPLYLAIKFSNKICPPLLPTEQTKILGYADDTSIIVKDDEGIIESFKIVQNFEKSSNSKLNISKTKIYGFGLWENRILWPIKNLKIEMDYFKTLGIIFSCDYNIALNNTWTQIVNKIKKRIPLIKGNFYTIYQKSIIINSLILSKVWYTAHIYPLPEKFSKDIVTEIISFIWKKTIIQLVKEYYIITN